MTMKDFDLDLEVKRNNQKKGAETEGVSEIVTTVVVTSYLQGCTGTCTEVCSKHCSEDQRCGYSAHTYTCNAYC